MYAQPERLAPAAARRFADMMADYLRAQVAAGAQALQIFDSWAGALAPRRLPRVRAAPPRASSSALSRAGVPVIHFGVGTRPPARDMAEAGGDVIGVDWRHRRSTRLGDASATIAAMQGNLDPTRCSRPADALFAGARATSCGAPTGRPGHMFNLGHGISPTHRSSACRRSRASFTRRPPDRQPRGSMIVIVGAGITGLAAAYELASRDVPFRVVEAAARPGGLILTEHVEGFTIEAGPDSVLAQKPAAVALCEELGLGHASVARGARARRSS